MSNSPRDFESMMPMNSGWFSVTGCSAPVVALWLAGATPFSPGAEWPQYRGPSGSGSTPDKIQKTWPESGPRQLWKTPLSAGFSTFAVTGGKAYTLVLRSFEGVPNEACLALEAETGRELWAAPLGFAKYDGGGDNGAPGNDGGDGPRSTPAADGLHVYALNANLRLYCLDAQSGKVAWKKDLVKEYGGRNIAWQNA